jgi:hypothetical protein
MQAFCFLCQLELLFGYNTFFINMFMGSLSGGIQKKSLISSTDDVRKSVLNVALVGNGMAVGH